MNILMRTVVQSLIPMRGVPQQGKSKIIFYTAIQGMDKLMI